MSPFLTYTAPFHHPSLSVPGSSSLSGGLPPPPPQDAANTPQPLLGLPGDLRSDHPLSHASLGPVHPSPCSLTYAACLAPLPGSTVPQAVAFPAHRALLSHPRPCPGVHCGLVCLVVLNRSLDIKLVPAEAPGALFSSCLSLSLSCSVCSLTCLLHSSAHHSSTSSQPAGTGVFRTASLSSEAAGPLCCPESHFPLPRADPQRHMLPHVSYR